MKYIMRFQGTGEIVTPSESKQFYTEKSLEYFSGHNELNCDWQELPKLNSGAYWAANEYVPMGPHEIGRTASDLTKAQNHVKMWSN